MSIFVKTKAQITLAICLAYQVAYAQEDSFVCDPKYTQDACERIQNAKSDRLKNIYIESENARVRERERQQEYQENREKTRLQFVAARAAQKEKSDALLAETNRKLEAEERLAALNAKKSAAIENERKMRCGTDYKNPKIGMPISRVEDCVESVRLTAQINRADGVVSTYQSGYAYYHVMDGRVVSWGR